MTALSTRRILDRTVLTSSQRWSCSTQTNPGALSRKKINREPEKAPYFLAGLIGERQSPIDISKPQEVDLSPIQFDYKPSPLHTIDNGRHCHDSLQPCLMVPGPTARGSKTDP